MRVVGVPPGLAPAEVLVEFPPRRVLLAAVAEVGVGGLRAGLPDDEVLRALPAAHSHLGPLPASKEVAVAGLGLGVRHQAGIATRHARCVNDRP